MRSALEIVFWLCCGLIVWTQVGYAVALAVLARVFARADASPRERTQRSAAEPSPPGADRSSSCSSPLPSLSLIVAAHDEQAVIAAKVANALALDYPRELLEVIVACDGCADATAARARDAGADLVLELPRGGKIRAQDAAVQRARGEIVAFSDANALWEADAARALVRAFEDPRVGYACGQVRFLQAGTVLAPSTAPIPSTTPIPGTGLVPGTAAGRAGASEGASNQEGVYWRYELGIRALESRLSSITAGNGAIYATRRDSYIVVDPIMGHDLSLPFNTVKRGLRAVYVPGARANEKMVPSLGGEFARKRRMMSHTWPILLRGGMLSPRGYPPGYALMILSHRLLRYATPGLHALALAVNVALVAIGGGGGGARALYVVTLDLQLALLLAAALAGPLPVRPLLIARYYVLTTTSLAAGLWDWLRHGTDATWQAAEGTR
jgi:glycosyltransferase involved in cell wall biosynthesis